MRISVRSTVEPFVNAAVGRTEGMFVRGGGVWCVVRVCSAHRREA